MQRPFSRFPDGLPGIGLLLLRTTAGIAAVALGATHVRDAASSATLATWCTDGFVIGSGLAVVAGLYTPGTAALLALALLASPLSIPSQPFLLDPPVLLVIANAAALALLGPGAFSIDARLFGHREIVIPRDHVPPRG